jgi:N-acetyl sugar amidotransferase
MDTSDPHILFNADGICHHCLNYKKLRTETPKYNFDQFDALVTRMKKRGKKYPYDCVVGISGGTDSSYLLHQLKNAGLRVLAMHYDSGWNTAEAVHNVKVLIEKMGIELYTFKVDWEEFKAIQLAYLRAGVVDLDVPTDHALHGALYKSAADKKAPFILTGHNMSTESIMPDTWVFDKLDSKNLMDIYRKHGNVVPLKSFPLQTLKTKFLNYNIRKIEMIFMLNYMPYNKAEAAAILQKEYSWEPVRVKHGESIWTRFFQCYILPTRFGIDKRKAHFSNLILSGVMTREEAMAELDKPIYLDNLEDDKQLIFNRFGITENEFNEFMQTTKRSQTDFKTEKALKEFYAKMRRILPIKSLLRVSTRH